MSTAVDEVKSLKTKNKWFSHFGKQNTCGVLFSMLITMYITQH